MPWIGSDQWAAWGWGVVGRPPHSPLLAEKLLADEQQLARGVVGLSGHSVQLGLQASLLLQEPVGPFLS